MSERNLFQISGISSSDEGKDFDTVFYFFLAIT